MKKPNNYHRNKRIQIGGEMKTVIDNLIYLHSQLFRFEFTPASVI